VARPARSQSSATGRSGRAYGNLDRLTDSERRGLRPIGESVREVASRTATLFDPLMDTRNVRVFQAVCAIGSDAQRIPHAICAGRRVIFVDSVRWPPGIYTLAETTGRVHCDGLYIGQSIAPLITAVKTWQDVLPRHEVSALVVVHPNGEGGVGLYGKVPQNFAWTLAHDAVHDVRRLLPPATRATSRAATAALRDASGPAMEVATGAISLSAG